MQALLRALRRHCSGHCSGKRSEKGGMEEYENNGQKEHVDWKQGQGELERGREEEHLGGRGVRARTKQAR